MEESSFDVDSGQLRTLAQRYPEHHREVATAHPDADLTYVRTSRGAEFGSHCWDEGGH